MRVTVGVLLKLGVLVGVRVRVKVGVLVGRVPVIVTVGVGERVCEGVAVQAGEHGV